MSQHELTKSNKSDARISLENYMGNPDRNVKYSTNQDLLDYLDTDHALDIEVWSDKVGLMYATYNFYKNCSLKMGDLYNLNRHKLFTYGDFFTAKIDSICEKVYTTGVTSFNVTPVFDLMENSDTKKVRRLEIKAISPFYALSLDTPPIQHFIAHIFAVKYHTN